MLLANRVTDRYLNMQRNIRKLAEQGPQLFGVPFWLLSHSRATRSVEPGIQGSDTSVDSRSASEAGASRNDDFLKNGPSRWRHNR
jgi:hypothetical protein